MKVFEERADRVNAVSVDHPSDVVTALLKAAVALRGQFSDFLERFEMTAGRYAVLTALDRAGSVGLSQASVAEELMHSESNVSSLIDRLQHDGLVDRHWSSTDRRKRVLLLTPAGQVMVDQIEAARRSWAEDILSGITADDQRHLLQLLHRLPGRMGVESGRQASSHGVNRVHEPMSAGADWQGAAIDGEIEPASPQSALERLLSTLGMASRFGEDER